MTTLTIDCVDDDNYEGDNDDSPSSGIDINIDNSDNDVDGYDDNDDGDDG